MALAEAQAPTRAVARPAPPLGRPLHVMHVVYRFDTGGLENGVVNLVNRMPADRVRHTIVALTEVAPHFSARIQRPDVQFLSLHKPPGQLLWEFPRLYRLFRSMVPDVLHTRNLAALECHLPARLAGIGGRVHSEHGRDVDDLQGTNRKHLLIRRLHRAFPGHYIALSRELTDYLRDEIGVPPARLSEICNGVDVDRFAPPAGARQAVPGHPFGDPDLWVVGTVGRMQAVKAQTLLTRAFVRALEMAPPLRARLRLVLVGDGPLRAECEAGLAQAGAADLAWLPGERADVPDVMRSLDAFVLPSLAEGISNTILEAMASGLPVIATRVGGNADLVVDGETGDIVPAGDVDALARALVQSASDPARSRAQGRRARERVEARYGLPAMVDAYLALYEAQAARHAARR